MGVCFKGNIEVAKLLIVSGANVNILNSQNASAVIYAAMFGHKEIILLLIKNGADINVRDIQGNSVEIHIEKLGLNLQESINT